MQSWIVAHWQLVLMGGVMFNVVIGLAFLQEDDYTRGELVALIMLVMMPFFLVYAGFCKLIQIWID